MNFIERLLEHCEMNSLIINHLYTGHMYNMTRHPAVSSLGKRYTEYINYMRQMRLSPSFNMADRYTSAIYGAKDMINPTVMQQVCPMVLHTYTL